MEDYVLVLVLVFVFYKDMLASLAQSIWQPMTKVGLNLSILVQARSL